MKYLGNYKNAANTFTCGINKTIVLNWMNAWIETSENCCRVTIYSEDLCVVCLHDNNMNEWTWMNMNEWLNGNRLEHQEVFKNSAHVHKLSFI